MPPLLRNRDLPKRTRLVQASSKISVQKRYKAVYSSVLINNDTIDKLKEKDIGVAAGQHAVGTPLQENRRKSPRLAKAMDNDELKEDGQTRIVQISSDHPKDMESSSSAGNIRNRRIRRITEKSFRELRIKSSMKKYDVFGRLGYVRASEMRRKILPAKLLVELKSLSEKSKLPIYKQMNNEMLIGVLDIFAARVYNGLDQRLPSIIKDIKVEPECVIEKDIEHVEHAIQRVCDFQGYTSFDVNLQARILRKLILDIDHLTVLSRSDSINDLISLIEKAGGQVKRMSTQFNGVGESRIFRMDTFEFESQLSAEIHAIFQEKNLNINRCMKPFAGALKHKTGIALFWGMPDFLGYSLNNSNDNHPDIVVELKRHKVSENRINDVAQCLASTLLVAALHQTSDGSLKQAVYGYLIGSGDWMLEVHIKKDLVASLEFLEASRGMEELFSWLCKK